VFKKRTAIQKTKKVMFLDFEKKTKTKNVRIVSKAT